jgi:uncharacterized membrane protein YozB (DUF420 family)
MSSTSQTISAALSAGSLAAVATGLAMAIWNIRKGEANCTVRSISIAYIVFFFVYLLGLLGNMSGMFSSPDITGAGKVIHIFAHMALMILSIMFLVYARKIEDDQRKKANMAVFSILLILSLGALAYAFYETRSLVKSQPVARVNAFLNGRRSGAPSSRASSGSMESEGNYLPYTSRTPRV